MFNRFFIELRAAKIPVSLKEFLLLLEALDAGLGRGRGQDFYYLARSALVKDERFLDRFDLVFGQIFNGAQGPDDESAGEIPADWLKKMAEKHLTEDEKAQVEALGGWDRLMETLKKRLEEQQSRHQGGSKWIGTAGTSPFGAHGYNPEGIRIGQEGNRNFRAVKVWDRREFRDFDDTCEIGTRNIKLALRRLRKFARTGAAEELDLAGMIHATASKGWLDVTMRPERRNAVKVLVFFDVGGSMDWHIRQTEELFSAARGEFKSMNWVYFHNCLYEHVWRHNERRRTQATPTRDILRKYPADTKVIFVGDASMNPYEIAIPRGSVEHANEETGATWLARVNGTWDHLVWLNPVAENQSRHTPSISMVSQALGGRMFPLTLQGLEQAMRQLLQARHLPPQAPSGRQSHRISKAGWRGSAP